MPRYTTEPTFKHGTEPTVGVLVVNLGTPDAPTTPAVRRYLAQFLSDPRLIELPRWLWLPILHLVILRVRPSRSAKAYREIWQEDGSPLLTISQRLTERMATELNARTDLKIHVELGMTYGSPSIASALDRLHAKNPTRLIVLPLYPQYSATTTGSVMDQLGHWLNATRRIPDLSVITQYHDNPHYASAVANRIRAHWTEHGRGERLLFSFHGIPRRYLDSGDPYHCHCYKSARLIAENLGLTGDEWTISFQSRVGREEWLRPYTDELLEQWGQEGVGDIDVACPGFSIDCLETLEEIALQNSENFTAAGGGKLRYVACLNDGADHTELLVNLVIDRLGQTVRAAPDELELSRQLALEAGAAQ